MSYTHKKTVYEKNSLHMQPCQKPKYPRFCHHFLFHTSFVINPFSAIHIHTSSLVTVYSNGKIARHAHTTRPTMYFLRNSTFAQLEEASLDNGHVPSDKKVPLSGTYLCEIMSEASSILISRSRACLLVRGPVTWSRVPYGAPCWTDVRFFGIGLWFHAEFLRDKYLGNNYRK